MTRKMLYGRIFAIIGFIILLANATSYLSNTNWNIPYSSAGLLMCIVGAVLIKKGKN